MTFPVNPWNLLKGIPFREPDSIEIATLSPRLNLLTNWFTVILVVFLNFSLVLCLGPWDFATITTPASTCSLRFINLILISIMLVIGLTGFAGTGKSTVAKYLKKYNFVFVVFSDMLKHEAEKRNLLKDKSMEEQKEIMSRVGNRLREETGNKGILADLLIKHIKMQNSTRIAVDGFRSKEEVKAFRNEFKKFYLIYVEADPEVRLKRRTMEDPNVNRKNFFERDRGDVEKKGLGEVVKMADYKLDNNGNVKALENQIDLIMRKILG